MGEVLSNDIPYDFFGLKVLFQLDKKEKYTISKNSKVFQVTEDAKTWSVSDNFKQQVSTLNIFVFSYQMFISGYL